MSKVATGLLITLTINMFLFLGQLAFESVNPSARIFDRTTTLLNDADAGGYVINQSISGNLPASEASVSPTTGNVFTDLFTSIKGWILDSTGAKYIVAFLFAVPNFLKAMSLPGAFTFVVSAFWYSYNFFLLLMFLWGDRN